MTPEERVQAIAEYEEMISSLPSTPLGRPIHGRVTMRREPSAAGTPPRRERNAKAEKDTEISTPARREDRR
jgi:hypothetical protein